MPQIPLEQLFEELHSSEHGLSSEEARARLTVSGPNDPSPQHRVTFFRQLIGLFVNPLVAILLIASLISALLGDFVNASIIITIVLLSAAVNFIQTFRSQRAVEALRAKVAPTASTLRDGTWAEIPRQELVPGDVISLRAGDPVPADARLFQSQHLHVQQAALTGESLPVDKEAFGVAPAAGDDADALSTVYLGTSVVSGTAMALVFATGRCTEFGDIAARLVAQPPPTEFERGIQQFGLFITRTVFFLVLFVFLVNVAFHRQTLESLLFAVALAVGLTPEFLPMITTVTLARGAIRIARHRVIVKNLASIQNFGSIDVLCSDKTGTLTTGNMELDRHVDAAGKSCERVFLLAYLNSFHQTGVKNPLDDAILEKPKASPPEEAILRCDNPEKDGYRKIGEIPFDFERRRLSVVVERGGEKLLITKGAPESILENCTSFEVEGRQSPLDAPARKCCEGTYCELSAQGFRVLAVAFRQVPPQKNYDIVDEQALVLAGFLAFADPPLGDAATAVDRLRRDGVELKILTGDNELVTQHVCAQVGIDVGRVVLGDELERMSDAALAHIAEETVVFARVSPAQKNRIILALKHRKHVVGYLGDGINDAPSLHAADVGISVAGGVEVARDAADIILLERSLSVLHRGILEGRKAFGNVMKYLLMGTSSNFGNMFSMAAASVFLRFLPMLPTQILLNNFLYDISQVTIPTDNVDRSFMRKPRRWDIAMIRNFMIVIGPISSLYDFLTFYVLLQVFHSSERLFHTGWFVESLATQTLVLFVIRTAGNPLRSRPSAPLAVTTVLIVLIGLALPFTRLAGPLGFTALPGMFFLFLAGATITYLLLVEVVKRRLMRKLIRG